MGPVNTTLKMSSPVWNVPHLATGAPQPEVNPDKITVYNMRFCPFAERTILVLLTKNIPFDVVNINLKKKPTWFLENTWGTVSVVRYQGEHIMESLVNSDFIDELDSSTALHPADPLDKAMGRLLVEKFGKMRAPYYGVLMAKGETSEEINEKRVELFKEVKKTLDCMDKELRMKGTKFFSGNTIGMTDLMVWPWIERLPCLKILFNLEIPKEMTSLLAWIKNMWEMPAIKAYGLDGETHCKFYSQYASTDLDYDMLLTKGA